MDYGGLEWSWKKKVWGRNVEMEQGRNQVREAEQAPKGALLS